MNQAASDRVDEFNARLFPSSDPCQPDTSVVDGLNDQLSQERKISDTRERERDQALLLAQSLARQLNQSRDNASRLADALQQTRDQLASAKNGWVVANDTVQYLNDELGRTLRNLTRMTDAHTEATANATWLEAVWESAKSANESAHRGWESAEKNATRLKRAWERINGTLSRCSDELINLRSSWESTNTTLRRCQWTADALEKNVTALEFALSESAANVSWSMQLQRSLREHNATAHRELARVKQDKTRCDARADRLENNLQYEKTVGQAARSLIACEQDRVASKANLNATWDYAMQLLEEELHLECNDTVNEAVFRWQQNVMNNVTSTWRECEELYEKIESRGSTRAASWLSGIGLAVTITVWLA